jgi:exodeoxyribonuclease VII small subunit
MSDNSEQELTFEELMKDLEDCASTIEEGGLPLDEASKMYQRGMDLALEASRRLAGQELSIKSITDAYHEAMEEIQSPNSEDSEG